jgi:hypothetical protein
MSEKDKTHSEFLEDLEEEQKAKTGGSKEDQDTSGQRSQEDQGTGVDEDASTDQTQPDPSERQKSHSEFLEELDGEGGDQFKEDPVKRKKKDRSLRAHLHRRSRQVVRTLRGLEDRCSPSTG